MATSSTSLAKSEQLLFPERQRCRRCRGYFGFLVIDRQYCSYDCAGVSAPDVTEHPRSCWTDKNDPKYCYFSPDDADRAARAFNANRDPRERLHSYYCDRHHMWHIGHARAADGSLVNWVKRLTSQD